MKDYREVIRNVVDTLNEVQVKGVQNCQRMCTAIYTLGAVVEEMAAEKEACALKMGSERKAAEEG